MTMIQGFAAPQAEQFLRVELKREFRDSLLIGRKPELELKLVLSPGTCLAALPPDRMQTECGERDGGAALRGERPPEEFERFRRKN